MCEQKKKQESMAKIETINQIQGFDPSQFAIKLADLSENGEERMRLPVMTQLAWFRLKFPMGKISVEVGQSGDLFVAKARVYADYKDADNCFLAEATASRGKCEQNPSVSPREWAQTAAIGIALRNAGFGLQFAIAGEDFEDIAPDELGAENGDAQTSQSEEYNVTEEKEEVVELTLEERYKQALGIPCPITKYKGKTLGDLVVADPSALKWLATKYSKEDGVKAAAQAICDYALQTAA